MYTEPRVLNKYHGRGIGVYIGRPSKWGNPFVLGRDGTRQEVVSKFESWVRTQPELMKAIKEELKGKNLICYCAPNTCHGDVLIKIANE